MAKNLEISFLLDFYGSMLTEKQRIMIEYYYNDDLSLAEIADNEGITRQGVRDIIKRAEGQLLKYEECLKLSENSREQSRRLNAIMEAAKEIAEYNLRYGCSREINGKSKEIYETAEKMKI